MEEKPHVILPLESLFPYDLSKNVCLLIGICFRRNLIKISNMKLGRLITPLK